MKASKEADLQAGKQTSKEAGLTGSFPFWQLQNFLDSRHFLALPNIIDIRGQSKFLLLTALNFVTGARKH